MTGPLYAIGRLCSRRHYPTIAAWLAIALVFVGRDALTVAGPEPDRDA